MSCLLMACELRICLGRISYLHLQPGTRGAAPLDNDVYEDYTRLQFYFVWVGGTCTTLGKISLPACVRPHDEML